MRIAIGVLAAAFAAAPALAFAAAPCAPCCCPGAPSQPASSDCGDTTLAAPECCDLDGAAIPSSAERAPATPALEAVTPARARANAGFARVRPPTCDFDLDARTSPLRLSVVLRI